MLKTELESHPGYYSILLNVAITIGYDSNYFKGYNNGTTFHLFLPFYALILPSFFRVKPIQFF